MSLNLKRGFVDFPSYLAVFGAMCLWICLFFACWCSPFFCMVVSVTNVTGKPNTQEKSYASGISKAT